MARLPTAEQLGERPVPRVQGGVIPVQTATPDLSAESKATAEFSDSLAGLGNTLAVMAENERRKLEAVKKEEAVNTYLDGLLKLENDPKEGFANVLGGDAVKRPLMDEYRKKREDLRNQIRSTLPTKNLQQAFDANAMVADRPFDARLYRHIADQSRAYQGSVYAGVVGTERRMAAQLWDQPGQIELSLLRIGKTIEDKAAQDGLSMDRPEDRAIIENQKAVARSMVYSDVIDTMLVQHKDQAAASFYNAIKDKLTPESLVTMGAKVDGASTDGEAMRGADDVWAALGPKAPNQPVRLDLMEEALRKQYSDNPRIYHAAAAEIRTRAVAYRDSVNQVQATNSSAILKAYNEGSDLKSIQAMPEYLALDGAEQQKLTAYIKDRGYSEQQHLRAEREYLDGEKARLGFGRYWELSNPRVLGSMSEQQILALEPELGRSLTGQLMQMRRSIEKKVFSANMDTDAFNRIASDAGLKPYEPKPNAEQKEQLGRLRSQVESAISTQQEKLGRELDRGEKEAIMKDVIKPQVTQSTWFGLGSKQVPAATVTNDQRGKVYVPIEQIEGKWLAGAINYMRSVGAVPTTWNDAKIREKYRDRLEKAYAYSITYGGPDGGKKILEGQ